MEKAIKKAESEMSDSTDRRKNLIDLQDIVIRDSYAQFISTRTKRKHKKLGKDDLHFEVNWDSVKIEHRDPVYSPVNSFTSNPTKEIPGQVLFKTHFNNNTKEVQEYSFKTERTTTSTCTVAIEKGVCYGAELNLNIKTPCEILEAGATFSRELQFESTNENTKEEAVTWSVDSQIKVRAGCKTVAQLMIEEKSDIRDYKIETCIYGIVKTKVFRSKNNSLLSSTATDLYTMFVTSRMVTDLEKNSLQILRPSDPRNRWGRPVIVYENKGRCEFKFGVEQKVELSEEEIGGDNQTPSNNDSNNN